MDLPFRTEKRESFRVVGSLIQTTNQRGEGRKAIPAHWARFKAENLEQPLLALANQEPQGLFGINIYNTDGADPRKFEYAEDHWKNGSDGNLKVAAQIKIPAAEQGLPHRQDEIGSA